jgi:hypothetical protein
VRLVVDTGAGATIIAPDILDQLGYSAREHGEQVAITRSIAGREEGYMLRVKQLECLGVVEHDFVSMPRICPRVGTSMGLSGSASCGS